jgi:hypothetical protein
MMKTCGLIFQQFSEWIRYDVKMLSNVENRDRSGLRKYGNNKCSVCDEHLKTRVRCRSLVIEASDS